MKTITCALLIGLLVLAPTLSAQTPVTARNGDIVTLGSKTDAKCPATDATAEGVVCILKELSFLLQNALATTTADGGSATLGAKGDPKSALTDTSAISVVAVLKELSFLLQNTLTVAGTVQVGNTPNTTPILSSINAGGNTADVMAASTAPDATKKALVVVSSPNSFQFNCHDISGSITTGGTAQQLVAANTSRQRLFIVNYPDATTQGIATAETLWISIGGTATVSGGVPAAGVYPLKPGDVFDFGSGPVSTQAISVNGGLTGHKWAGCDMY